MRSWRRTRRALRTSRSALPFETGVWRASQVAGEQAPSAVQSELAVPLGGAADVFGLHPLDRLGQLDHPGGPGRARPVRGGPRLPGGPGRRGSTPSGRRSARRERPKCDRTCVRLYRTERAKSTGIAQSAPNRGSTSDSTQRSISHDQSGSMPARRGLRLKRPSGPRPRASSTASLRGEHLVGAALADVVEHLGGHERAHGPAVRGGGPLGVAADLVEDVRGQAFPDRVGVLAGDPREDRPVRRERAGVGLAPPRCTRGDSGSTARASAGSSRRRCGRRARWRAGSNRRGGSASDPARAAVSRAPSRRGTRTARRSTRCRKRSTSSSSAGPRRS